MEITEDIDLIDNQQNLNRLNTEITDLLSILSEQIKVIENSLFVNSHINKFKVNKENLLLLNQNKELNNLLSGSVPSCEEIEDGSEVDINITISEEAIGANIAHVIEIIIKTIKEVILRLSETFKLHYAHALLLFKKLKPIQNVYSSGRLDTKAFGDKKAKMIHYQEWDMITTDINRIWTSLLETNLKQLKVMVENGHNEFKLDQSLINKILRAFGKEVYVETVRKKTYYSVVPYEGKGKIELPKDPVPVSSLGWNTDNMKKAFSMCYNLLGLLLNDGSLKKSINEMRKINEIMVKKTKKSGDWLTDNDPEYFKEIQNVLKFYKDSLIYVIKGTLNLISLFGKFAASQLPSIEKR